MRGKTGRLRFELHGDTEVYIDNVFFKSETPEVWQSISESTRGKKNRSKKPTPTQ
jgi:hypothetical protein